ncbi:potassium channel family protein [Peribacillus acanthi]|uniref:potassium channel family protein n=1 Tax=Peribacillus acanthi TaxID=2171554 RepID=UPI000D3E1FB1|nr:potassium channel protein [Peribacillus acanthi]
MGVFGFGKYKHLINAIYAMLFVICIGTIGFILFEGLAFFDALWLTMITVLTVGYGDAVPQTAAGKMFALIIIPIGIGIVTYAIGAMTTLMLEGELSRTVGQRRLKRLISKLSGHVILCGYGRVGEQVCDQLKNKNITTVIIDQDINRRPNVLGGNIYWITGDATDDEVLREAGIERAGSLVASLPDDAHNVFVTLSAKGLNPSIKIVARAEKAASEEKMKKAGATKVINPSSIGGKQMVFSLLKPQSVEYVDMMLNTGEKEFGIEEIVLGKGGPLINRTIEENQIRKKYEVTIVAIIRKEELINNPDPKERLQEHDVLLVFGSAEQMKVFENVAISID